jgi:hypothetical protein
VLGDPFFERPLPSCISTGGEGPGVCGLEALLAMHGRLGVWGRGRQRREKAPEQCWGPTFL